VGFLHAVPSLSKVDHPLFNRVSTSAPSDGGWRLYLEATYLAYDVPSALSTPVLCFRVLVLSRIRRHSAQYWEAGSVPRLARNRTAPLSVRLGSCLL
jgi:hypothetical protein